MGKYNFSKYPSLGVKSIDATEYSFDSLKEFHEWSKSIPVPDVENDPLVKIAKVRKNHYKVTYSNISKSWLKSKV
jgi:hypothetical protein